MSKSLPLVKYGPWSPSKSTLAGTCALAFKYRYVDKINVGIKGTPAKVGVVVHRAQELVLQESSATDALNVAIKEAEHELTHSEIESIRTFAQSIQAFYVRIYNFDKNYPIRKKYIENKWAITVDFEPCDFDDERAILRGIVDLGLDLENGRVIIIDHKTGKVRPAAYYKTQLDFYTIMALARFPDLMGVQCALHYVAPSKLEWSKPVNASYIREVLHPWLLGYLNKKALRVDTSAASLGRHCEWCDFKNICSARRGHNGEAGEGGSEGQQI